MKSLIFITYIFFTFSNDCYAQKFPEQAAIINKPEISWGKYIPGRMKADSFKAQSQIVLPKDYVLKKATIYFSGANFSLVKKLDIYTQDLSEVRETINKCVPGTVVYIEKILVVYKKDQELFLRNAGFLLY